MALLAEVVFLSTFLSARSMPPNQEIGNLRIFVVDEEGAPARNAPIYIVDARQILHVLLSDEKGYVDIDIATGDYTFSSAQTRPVPGYLDRLLSPSVRLHILPNENTTLLLPLRVVEDVLPTLYLSTLLRIGVSDEVAKYANQ